MAIAHIQCPRCRWEWVPRVVMPKECPSCKYRPTGKGRREAGWEQPSVEDSKDRR